MLDQEPASRKKVTETLPSRLEMLRISGLSAGVMKGLEDMFLGDAALTFPILLG